MLRLLLVASDPDLGSRVQALFEGEEVRLTQPSRSEGLADSVAADPPDAAAVDLGLPDDEGWNLLRSLRERLDSAALPIVGLSSLDTAEESLRAFELGANDVLRSPFDAHELILRTRRMIASLRDRSASLRGRLEIYPLPDLLQGCERSSWTGSLRLFGSGVSARIHFQHGKIDEAETGRLQGIEALWSAMEHTQGDFVLTAGAPQGEEPPIVPSIRSLLIDVGWAAQELSERSRFLPAPETPLSFSNRALTLAEALPRLPVQQILDLLEARGPLSFLAILAATDAAPMRVRLAVAVLLEKGAIAAPAPSAIVSIFYAGAARSGLRAFLASLPATEALPPSLAGAAGERGQRFVSWPGREEPILIRYEPLALDSVSEMFHRAREATSVVLWLGPDLSAEGIPMPLQLLQTAARAAEHLLLVTEPRAAGERMLSELEGGARWTSAPETHGSLAELLRNSSQGRPGLAAAGSAGSDRGTAS